MDVGTRIADPGPRSPSDGGAALARGDDREVAIPGYPTCTCCGGTRFSYIVRQIRSIYSSAPYDVVRCRECGHGVTMPVPSPEDLKAIYDRSYFYDVHHQITSEKAYRARSLSEEIWKLRPANGHFRILEIGCMYGVLLKELMSRGARAKGVELSEEPARHCKEIGLDVSAESVEQFVARAPDERFDAVVLSHVLEHLLDPREMITRLLGLLSDGGYLVVCVPNSRCLHAKVAGRNWGWWQVPVHVNHFCESSARRFFGSLGLEVRSTKVRGGDSLTLLLTAMNALGASQRARTGSLTPLKRFTIAMLSRLLRGYHRIGSDELIVICQYHGETR